MIDTDITKSTSPDTLVDFAYHEIRKDITEEFLKPGSKVKIKMLCERYNISQTPIKQALNRLMMQGLVENIPRRGYRVRRVTWNEIDEVLELRLMMELYLADKIIASINSNIVLQSKFESNLKENLELAENFKTADDYFRAYAMDQQFHELYIMSSGNHMALRTYKGLNTHAYATYLFGKQPQEKTVDGILEHQRIYESLREGNAAEAKKQLTIHTENAREIIHLSLKLGKLI